VALPALLAALLSVVLTGLSGVAAARINGWDRLAAANIGLTTLARGEFALILGALAVAAGLDERIAGFVALYVLVLAVASPILATRSAALSRAIPRRLMGHPQIDSA
jgi:CPA2 family monovalent cation:H+ antiporter-2